MNNKLLELARAVVHSEIPANYSYCPFCDNDYMGGENDTHTDACPWLLLKQEVQRIDLRDKECREFFLSITPNTGIGDGWVYANPNLIAGAWSIETQTRHK